MTFKDRLILSEGQTLEFVNSREKGFMGETEIDTYKVVDATGAVVGSVIHTQHVAVNGFKKTESVEQRNASGDLIREASWNP